MGKYSLKHSPTHHSINQPPVFPLPPADQLPQIGGNGIAGFAIWLQDKQGSLSTKHVGHMSLPGKLNYSAANAVCPTWQQRLFTATFLYGMALFQVLKLAFAQGKSLHVPHQNFEAYNIVRS